MDVSVEQLKASIEPIFPGDASVRIGIIDGLPDLGHRAFRDARIRILTELIPQGESAPDPHGTQICSLLFGNGDPIGGISPACSGLVLPVFLRGQPSGSLRSTSQLDLARAIEFALENDVSIINISAGQKVISPEADEHLERALKKCALHRVLVVAAVGNDGCACLHLPASVSTVLAVGALDSLGRPLEISNWGSVYQQNGILAPGDNVTVADLGGGITTARGTSYATALVSGVAALLFAEARRNNYQIDPIEIGEIILRTATPCASNHSEVCSRFLHGILNVKAAIAGLKQKDQRRRAAKSESAILSAKNSEVTLLGEQAAMSTEIIDQNNSEAVIQSIKPISERADNSSLDQKLACNNELLRPSERSEGLGPIRQQGCSCGGGSVQIVYAIGSLGYDFGTEARFDIFAQQLGGRGKVVDSEIVKFLSGNPHFLTGFTFVLMQDQTPVYAIQPSGPFAQETYKEMLEILESSLDEDPEVEQQRVSIPGLITGSTRLMNGMTVPIIVPDLRGMCTWQPKHLIEATRDLVPDGGDSDEALLNFLNRVYYELRNLGITPGDRAMNFAATNAYQARQAFAQAASKSLVLDSIRVQKSPICRPDSDCWDVELVMFDDENDRRANWIYRYTVDVSEVIPVTVGPVRSWAARVR